MLTRVIAATSLLCLIMPAAFARGFTQGDKMLVLSGTGSSDDEFVDNDVQGEDDAFDDGRFVYTLGIGFRWR